MGVTVLMSAILAGLELMVYRSLAPLERGQPQGGAVWEPIAVVYELCGYTAAMSVIPAMWACLMGIVAWQTWLRIKRTSASAAENAPPDS